MPFHPSASPVRIFWRDEEDLGTVILKGRWVADNGVETSCFATREDAEAFARVRWGWAG